jgi:hypothetical protein
VPSPRRRSRGCSPGASIVVIARPCPGCESLLTAAPDARRGRPVVSRHRCRLDGWRVRAMIAVLWRAGLRVQKALALAEHALDPRRRSILIRHGRAAAGARSAWTSGAGSRSVPAWTGGHSTRLGRCSASSTARPRARSWSGAAVRTKFRRLAARAGVRRPLPRTNCATRMRAISGSAPCAPASPGRKQASAHRPPGLPGIVRGSSGPRVGSPAGDSRSLREAAARMKSLVRHGASRSRHVARSGSPSIRSPIRESPRPRGASARGRGPRRVRKAVLEVVVVAAVAHRPSRVPYSAGHRPVQRRSPRRIIGQVLRDTGRTRGHNRLQANARKGVPPTRAEADHSRTVGEWTRPIAASFS